MCGKHSDNSFERVVAELRSARSLLIVTHARPDGDAIGSMAALARSAGQAGRTATTLVPDRLPERYGFLWKDLPVAGAERMGELSAQADRVVLLDTCAFAQLDGLEAALRACRDKVLAIDHHATRDDLAAACWIDPSAAAAGVMVAEVIEALGWPVDATTAEALLTALVSDTGWLRFANTDARCLRAAARWVELGVRTDRLYRRIYQSDRPQRLAMTARALASMELHGGGRLAAMTIRRKDFAETGARPDETENLVNEALRIGSVETAVLFVEQEDCVRVSLRSRDEVDVAELARRFGGGGHCRAAGLRAKEDVEQIKRRVLEACAAELDSGLQEGGL